MLIDVIFIIWVFFEEIVQIKLCKTVFKNTDSYSENLEKFAFPSNKILNF